MTARRSHSPLHQASVTHAGLLKESKMNMNLSRKGKSVRAGGLSFAMTVAIGIAGAGIALTPRPAQAVFASEPTQILNNISLLLNQIQDYTAYGEDVIRWRQQAQDMQKQLNSLMSLVSSFGMPASSTGQLTKADPNKVVRDRCGDGGSVMSNLLGSFSLNPDGDIAAQQTRLCAAITTMETYQYNESVDFINITLPQIEADLKQIEATRNSNTSSSGATEGLNVDATKFLAKYQSQFDMFKTRMNIYNESADGLRAQQRVLTTIALRGKRGTNMVGQLGKTLILKQALGQ